MRHTWSNLSPSLWPAVGAGMPSFFMVFLVSYSQKVCGGMNTHALRFIPTAAQKNAIACCVLVAR
ncbi:MAG TPA: hypothetical protein VN663_16165 [Ramlibacter sp.]|nr:hypothetical protein [Ramlibacter sp.]